MQRRFLRKRGAAGVRAVAEGCSLLTPKEKKSAAVPARHKSPTGAFKSQTGLRSKCCAFSTARSQRFRRAGSTKKGLLAPFNRFFRCSRCIAPQSRYARQLPPGSEPSPSRLAPCHLPRKGEVLLYLPEDAKKLPLRGKTSPGRGKMSPQVTKGGIWQSRRL